MGDAVGLGGPMIRHIETGARDPKLSHVEAIAATVGLRLTLVEDSGTQLSPDDSVLLERFRLLLTAANANEKEIWALEIQARLRQLGLVTHSTR